MAIPEISFKWPTFTSTGSGKAVKCHYAQAVTLGFETSAGCTATVQVLHRMGSSAGVYVALSTLQLDTVGAFTTDQYMGPLVWVKPRVVDKTAGGSTNTVDAYLEGN